MSSNSFICPKITKDNYMSAFHVWEIVSGRPYLFLMKVSPPWCPRVQVLVPASPGKQPPLSLHCNWLQLSVGCLHELSLDGRCGGFRPIEHRDEIGKRHWRITIIKKKSVSWVFLSRVAGGSWQQQTSDWKLCGQTASSRGCLQLKLPICDFSSVCKTKQNLQVNKWTSLIHFKGKVWSLFKWWCQIVTRTHQPWHQSQSRAWRLFLQVSPAYQHS